MHRPRSRFCFAYLVVCALSLCTAELSACGDSGASANEAKKKGKKGKRGKKGKNDPHDYPGAQGIHLEPTAGTRDLAVYTQRIEDLVTAQDIIGLARTWARGSTLEGCTLVSEEKKMPTLGKLLGDRRKSFDEDIRKSAAKDKAGRVLDANFQQNSAPFPGPEQITGEDCPAESSGLITIYANPDDSPSEVITHSFETTFVADEWRTVGYSYRTVDCEADEATAQDAGCVRLRSLTATPDPPSP